MALAPARRRARASASALLDLSTGEFTAAEYAGADGAAGARRRARGPAAARDRRCRRASTARRRCSPRRRARGAPVTPVDGWTFELEPARRTLLDQLRDARPRRLRPRRRTRRGRAPPARWSHYLRDTQKADLAHVRAIALPQRRRLPARSIRRRCKHLEIIEGVGRRPRRVAARRARSHGHADGRPAAARVAAAAARRARARSSDRLDAVEELAFRTTERGKLRDALKAVHDLERLVARAALGTAGPRDLVGAAAVARRRPARAAAARASCRRRSSRSLVAELDDLADVRDAHRAHADRRAAGARARRRRHPRRRRPRARRAARRSAARASRSSPRWKTRERARTGIALAEDPLQPRLRLLHRDLEVEPRTPCRPTTTASRRSPAASASSRRR